LFLWLVDELMPDNIIAYIVVQRAMLDITVALPVIYV
jgi:hypothetical protein